jgi:hypothetical protein
MHKISSVCKYCPCSAAVRMMRMRAEFVGPLGRHGRHLQTMEPRLRIVLCVYNFQENRETRHMWSPTVTCFLHARNMKPADIHHQLCVVYGEHDMSDSMVRKWVRHFNEGRENVHDDPRSGWPPVVNEDLVRTVEEKIQENRRSTLSSFSCIFYKFHGHFMKLCLINFVLGNFVHAGCRRCLQRTQNETAGQCFDLSDTIQWAAQSQGTRHGWHT